MSKPKTHCQRTLTQSSPKLPPFAACSNSQSLLFSRDLTQCFNGTQKEPLEEFLPKQYLVICCYLTHLQYFFQGERKFQKKNGLGRFLNDNFFAAFYLQTIFFEKFLEICKDMSFIYGLKKLVDFVFQRFYFHFHKGQLLDLVFKKKSEIRTENYCKEIRFTKKLLQRNDRILTRIL